MIPNKLNFYGSYYRPQNSRENRANRYGELPNYERTRNEGFGKLTFTPTSSVLLNVSYRDSHRLDTSDLFASNASATTGTGNEAWQTIGSAEGSWVINSRSHLTFRYTDYTNETQGRPDNIAGVSASTAIGTRLDVNRLDQIGLLTVPAPVAGQTAFNDFVQPLIDRYGYVDERREGRRRHGRLRDDVRRGQLLPRRPGRSPTTSLSAGRSGTTCTSAISATSTPRT